MCIRDSFIGIGLVTAQVTKVTGTVISEEDGLPVVGASILVKGTTVGTVTDMDGKFTLSNVPSSAKTLVVSFIGMATQEVAIKQTVNITLKSDAEVLEEVVVTGYGNFKKSSFTGSASNVSTEIPVSCAFAVSNPNKFPVCDASTFHAFMILSTWSTDCVTFVPLIDANCMNCFDVFSSSVPVVWNLSLIHI